MGTAPTPSKRPRKGSRELDQDEAEMVSAPPAKAAAAVPEITVDRYKHFMKLLYKLVQEKYQTQTLEMPAIRTHMKRHETENPFSEDEIDRILDKMQDDNKIM